MNVLELAAITLGGRSLYGCATDLPAISRAVRAIPTTLAPVVGFGNQTRYAESRNMQSCATPQTGKFSRAPKFKRRLFGGVSASLLHAIAAGSNINLHEQVSICIALPFMRISAWRQFCYRDGAGGQVIQTRYGRSGCRRSGTTGNRGLLVYSQNGRYLGQENVRTGKLASKVQEEDLKTRIYIDTAILTHKDSLQTADGSTVEMIATRVFVKQHGSWKLASCKIRHFRPAEKWRAGPILLAGAREST